MPGLRNQTFGDQDPNLKYIGGWKDGIWNALNGDNGTLHVTNGQSAGVTFTFPVSANAFYYYGMKRSNGGRYGICIDDPNCNPNLRQIDAFDSEDDGPVLLFSQHFDTLAQHNITLINLEDPRGNPPGNSQMTLVRFELQVHREGDSTPPSSSSASGTSPSSSATGTPVQPIVSGMSDASLASASAPPAASSSAPTFSNDASPTGAIIGGIVGALIALFVFLLLFLRKRNIRRRKRHAESSIGTYSTGLDLSTNASHIVSSNYTHSKQYRSQKESSNSLGYEFGYGVGIGISDMNKLDKKRSDGAIAKGSSSKSKSKQKEHPEALGYELGYGVGVGLSDMNKLDQKRSDGAIVTGSSKSKSKQKESPEALGYELGYGVGVGLSDMNKLDQKGSDGAIAKGSSESKSSHSRRAVDAGRVLDSRDTGVPPPGYDQVFRGDERLVPLRREEV